MIIAASVWRKAFLTLIAGGAFVALYEVTILDSETAARQAALREAGTAIAPGARLTFAATAYCKGLVTTSGVAAQTGIAASDPSLLPVGSVIQIGSLGTYDGIYTVLDTGPAVQGREVDLYMWSCHEALAFGRRPIQVTVLRLGWDPRATTPGIFNRWMTRPEERRLSARPLPQDVRAPDNR